MRLFLFTAKAGVDTQAALGGLAFVTLTAASPALAEPLVELARKGGSLRAAVSPEHGGELASLRVRHGGKWIELLYRGRNYEPTEDWSGRAPLLWPATGRSLQPALTGELMPTWSYAERRLEMPIHGFARDRRWSIGHRSGDKVSVSFADDPESRRIYPFGFRVSCDYRLSRNSIQLRYVVRAAATNRQPMPFSIGNHMTFAVPLVPGTPPGSMTVLSPAEFVLPLDQASRPTGAIVRNAQFRTPRPLASLASRRAIPLGGYKGEPWLRLSDPGGLNVTITHSPDRLAAGEPVMFNLWGDINTGFISPQPWYGRQNSLNTGDGLVRLAPGKVFRWTITIAVDDAIRVK